MQYYLNKVDINEYAVSYTETGLVVKGALGAAKADDLTAQLAELSKGQIMLHIDE